MVWVCVCKRTSKSSFALPHTILESTMQQRAATSKEMQYTELQCASHITSYIEIFTQIGLGLGNMRVHCQQ